jgi:hypothetical protein
MTQNMTNPQYESYTDNLRTLVEGKQYSGKNVLTKDGKMGYITDTGIIKQYSSPKSLTVLNGCTTSYEQLNAEWDKLGFPIGSAMIDGQTCGNETKYIQSKPPSNNFDWKYYIAANPDLNLTTEQQAIDHWKNTGIQQGLLPNENILSEMSNVGKIGYVDVNTTLHTVPANAYTYTGNYKLFKNINVTGANMTDCSRKIPPVKYGDQVFMRFNDKYAKMNNTSLLEFGSDRTKFFLRPLGTNANSMTGKAIKYGDQISIAVSSNNWIDTICGLWGCKVAYINPNTYLVGFGPGGEKGGSIFTITPAVGSPYTVGTELKYNDSFILTSVITGSSTLRQDQFLRPGEHITSENGNYVFTYQMDGNICLYDSNDGALIWTSDKPHKPKKLLMQTDGNLVAFDVNGRPQWSSNSRQRFKTGTSINCKLSVENDRNVVISRSSGAKIWETNTKIILTEDDGNMYKIGYVNNKNLKFGSSADSVGKCEFTFQDSSHPQNYDLSCDVNLLTTECTADNSCAGYIHSAKDNTWQKIPNNATPDLYKITDSSPSIFVKEMNVDMNDKSCLSGKSKFINSNEYSHYPKGNDFSMNSDQCNLQTAGIAFPIDNQNYNQMNNQYITQNTEMMNKYPRNEFNIQQNNELYRQMQSKTNEYATLLNTIKSEKNNNVITYQQMNEDLHGIENTNKSNALLWGLSSIVLIGIVITVRNGIKY